MLGFLSGEGWISTIRSYGQMRLKRACYVGCEGSFGLIPRSGPTLSCLSLPQCLMFFHSIYFYFYFGCLDNCGWWRFTYYSTRCTCLLYTSGLWMERKVGHNNCLLGPYCKNSEVRKILGGTAHLLRVPVAC